MVVACQHPAREILFSLDLSDRAALAPPMNATAPRLFIVIASCTLVLVGQADGADHGARFRSDSNDLALTGVWIVVGKGLSIGIRNAGDRPIKAFRARLVALNDFDEPKGTMDIEFSSQTEYHSADNRILLNHTIAPHETLFFNLVLFGSGATKEYFSSVSYISLGLGKGKSVAGAEFDKMLDDGKHLLQVNKILTADISPPDEQPRTERNTSPAPMPTETSDSSSVMQKSTAAPRRVLQYDAAVTRPTSAEPQEETLYYIPGSDLNVRTGPNIKSAIDGKLPGGFEGIRIIGASVVNDGTEWVPIAFGSHSGWVARQFIKPQ